MYYARFALLGLLVVWASASAQPFPSKQVRLITPFPPGGSADVIARIAGRRLGEVLGQPVLVENRAGAGGVVGSDYVAKQLPDGHTLLLVTGAYPVSAVMMKALPFDPLNDIAMVSLLTSYPFVISVAPGSPFKSLGELIAYAKAHPGKLNYPSGGIGTVHHLSGELFNTLAGTDLTHIPYRGGNALLIERLDARTDLLHEAITLATGRVRAGRLAPVGGASTR